MKLEVLLVGGDHSDLSAIPDHLSTLGVRAVDRGEAALAVVEEHAPCVVVIDEQLPDMPGLQLAQAVASRWNDTQAVLIAGAESIGEVLGALRDGLDARCILRPFEAAKLAREVTALVQQRRAPAGTARDDRRAYPRGRLEERSAIAPPGVEVLNITPGGVLLLGPPRWSVGERIELVLRLTHLLPPQRFSAEVVRKEPDKLGREAIAARFIDPSPRMQMLIRKLILEQMAFSGLRKLQRRFREVGAGEALFTEQERIDAFLQRSWDQGLAYLVNPQRDGRLWRTPLAGLDLESREMRLGPPPPGLGAVAGQELDFFLHMGFESYLFAAHVLEVGPQGVRCAFPGVVYFSEKRSRPRQVLDPGMGIHVEVDAPPPWGRQRWPLYDVSPTGLSFLAPADGILLMPGTPFRPLRLVLGDRILLEEEAEVRHVAPTGDGGRVKVGAALRPAQRRAIPSGALAPNGLSPGPTAPSASAPVSQADGPRPRAPRPRVLKFLNSRNEEVVALYNTSVQGEAHFAGPVVIIPPAWGRSKESFSTLALWLCDRLGHFGQPVAVLRFDFTHCKGESYVPPANRAPGREALDFTPASGLDDLLAAIRFVHHTPLFTPTAVVLVGYSFSAPMVLRAAALDSRVTHVVCPMGTPSMQELTRNASGGLDYLGGYRDGLRFAVVNFLGYLTDMDAACRDAIRYGMASLDDAKRDLASLSGAVSWVLAEHDAWVDPNQVRDLLSVKRSGPPPDLLRVSAGHVPTSSEEATVTAEAATGLVWRHLHGTEILPIGGPSAEVIEAVAREEWARAPKAAMGDARTYWADYLLGEGDGALGYDILCHVEAYADFMRLQVEMLKPAPGQMVLDAGGGTGNFLDSLLASKHPLPAAVEMVDLVPRALERARVKTEARAAAAGVDVRFRSANLEVSRLRPIERFLRGEMHSPACLRDRVAGLDDDTLDRILELYGARMHSAVRGGPQDASLAEALGERGSLAVLDLSRAARLLTGRVGIEDLRPERAAEARPLLAAGRQTELRASHLRFDVIELDDARPGEGLSLEDEAYDAIIASLLLSYLFNPDETLCEFHRALRPGGRLVVSTMKPDTDISKIYKEFVDSVATGRLAPPPGLGRDKFLDELRCYTNSAAFLLRLAEERTFRLFPAEELRTMLEEAGFREVEVRAGFGDPPQAYVAAGIKP